MRNEKLETFIQINKEKIFVNRNKKGEVVSIKLKYPLYTEKDDEKLDFDNDNYHLSSKRNKPFLRFKDDETNEDVFVPIVDNYLKYLDKEKRRVDKLKYKKDMKSIKFSFSSLFGGIKKINKVQTSRNPFERIMNNKDDSKITKDNKPSENEKRTPISSTLGDYNTIKESADKLIEKLDEIFKAVDQNEKYKIDKELIDLKIKYKGIVERYKNGLKMVDTQEILNSKVKLVSLSGRVISRMKNIDTLKITSDKPRKIQENPVEAIPEDAEEKIKEQMNKTKQQPENPFVNTTELSPVIDATTRVNNPDLNNMKDVTPNNENNNSNTNSNADSNSNGANVNADVTTKVEKTVEKTTDLPEDKPKNDDEIRKQAILDEIDKAKSNVKHAEENVKYYEDRIKKVEEIIKTENLDSREIRLYESVKLEHKDNLEKAKAKLEETRKLEQAANAKLNDFMNEKVIYYVDGKPYKTVTRKELEIYEKNNAIDVTRMEDYQKQKQLLEERKELERKLKENMEALKGLSTFDENMLMPKQEAPIEEVMETVRRFHQ